MKRSHFLTTLAALLIAGVSTVALAPLGWVVPVLFLSFTLCILLCWLVIFQSRPFNLTAGWHLVFFGPFKLTATIKTSGRLLALWVAVAYLAGLFLGIAWVSHA